MLTLVAAPVGAFLAGSQASLEAEWKGALARDHGVAFDRLFALTNVPMSRYLEWLQHLEWLEEKGQTAAYRRRLVGAFNPAAVGGLMCRTRVSVGWDGRVYDCDFNQPLEIGAAVEFGHVAEFDLEARHCYDVAALLRVHGRGRLLLRRRHHLSGPGAAEVRHCGALDTHAIPLSEAVGERLRVGYGGTEVGRGRGDTYWNR